MLASFVLASRVRLVIPAPDPVSAPQLTIPRPHSLIEAHGIVISSIAAHGIVVYAACHLGCLSCRLLLAGSWHWISDLVCALRIKEGQALGRLLGVTLRKVACAAVATHCSQRLARILAVERASSSALR